MAFSKYERELQNRKNKDVNTFYTPRLKESRAMIDKATEEGGFAAGTGMALRRFSGDVGTTVRDYLTPKPLRDIVLGAGQGIGTALSTAATGKYEDKPDITPDITPTLQTLSTDVGPNLRSDRMQGAPITMTGTGITGDIDTARTNIQKNRLQQYGLDGINKQNPDGSFDVNNLNVKFDADTDPEAAKRFLSVPLGGGRGPRTTTTGTFQPTYYDQGQASGNGLPSKEGMSRHQYQQLLKNKGLLDVKEAGNLGSLAEQRLQSKTAVTTQGMRTQGLRDIASVNQAAAQNKARIKNTQAMKDRESKNLKSQYDILGTQLEDLSLSADERLKLQKQRAGIGKLLHSSLQTIGQVAQRKAFEDQAAGY